MHSLWIRTCPKCCHVLYSKKVTAWPSGGRKLWSRIWPVLSSPAFLRYLRRQLPNSEEDPGSKFSQTCVFIFNNMWMGCMRILSSFHFNVIRFCLWKEVIYCVTLWSCLSIYTHKYVFVIDLWWCVRLTVYHFSALISLNLLNLRVVAHQWQFFSPIVQKKREIAVGSVIQRSPLKMIDVWSD